MPVVDARLRQEQTIINKIKSASAKRRKELVVLLGDPPDIKNVPQSFWDKIEEEDAAMLLLLLIAMHKTGTRTVAQQTKFAAELDEEFYEEQAQKYAERRVRKVIPKSVRNSKQMASDIVKSKTKLGDRLKQKDFEPVFGQSRGEGLAVTETTAATSHAENTIAKAAKKKDKLVLVIWDTSADDKVCVICRPLHRKPERVWSRVFPDGPPGHPNCRCSLEVIIDGESGGRFLPQLQRVADTEEITKRRKRK